MLVSRSRGVWWVVGRLFGLLSLAAFAACGGDGFSPTVENVSGAYRATRLTVTEGGGPAIDYLALGASMELTLLSQGTTEGQFFVPGGAEGGGDVDLQLTGTWTLDGDEVTLHQEADTFLRDLVLTASEGRLDGEFLEEAVRVQVRLEKPSTNE